MNQESRIAALAQGKFIEGVLRNADPAKLYEEAIPVSYTHLTLPTIYSV